MKNCPFCDKEISDEAIICKFCHRLLIDENGNDIQPEPEADTYEEPAESAAEIAEETAEDDKTIVYSKDEFKKAMDELDGEEAKEAVGVLPDVGFEREFDGNFPELTEVDEDGVEYDDEAEEDYDEQYDVQEYDPKRTFIITAIITVGILIVIIAAVLVGYKLFGFGDEDTTSKTPVIPKPSANSAVSDDSAADSEDDEYVPRVTDDTVSEAPEETSDSTLEDPVSDADSAAEPASSDENAADDSSATDSGSDDSSTDSVSDDPAADTPAETAPPAEGDPGFAPAGSYYNWSEAFTIIDNYFTANSMNGSYSYAYGTDGVEMVFVYTDESGNTANYRVDLVTGAVSAI